MTSPQRSTGKAAVMAWRLAAAATLSSLLACAAAQDGPAAGAQDSARESITRLIGPARCQHDDDCRSVAVGVQACGGPQAYLPWSTRDTNVLALTDAVARHAQERRAQIERRGEMSTCAVVPDPGARCERSAGAASGRCVAGSGSRSGGALLR